MKRSGEEETQVLVAELIRGTPVEGDERELAQLRALPPEEQLAVGIVLRTVNIQEGNPRMPRDARLEEVRTIADAQRVLGGSRSDDNKKDPKT